MPKLRVTQDYAARFNESDIGFSKDDIVDLEEGVAEFVNRDAPGTLVAIKNPPSPASTDGQKGARSEDGPPSDRSSVPKSRRSK